VKKLILVVSTLLLGACTCPKEVLVCSYGGEESFRSRAAVGIRAIYNGRVVYQIGRWGDGKTYNPRAGEYCEVQPASEGANK